jgi:FHS family L-fucose permease-like MFS transporter
VLILPELTPEPAKTIMSPEELRASQEQDLSLVLGPYLGIAAVLVVIWLLIAFRRIDLPPVPGTEAVPSGSTVGRLWANPHYRYGVIAQFFNVAAQTCDWTFTILYAQDVVGRVGGGLRVVPAGQPDPVPGLPVRDDLAARAVPAHPAAADHGAVRDGAAAGGDVLAEHRRAARGRRDLGVAVADVPHDLRGRPARAWATTRSSGAAGLVMAILGGALLPMVHAAVMDRVGAAAGASSCRGCAWPWWPRTRCSICATHRGGRPTNRRTVV